jgi:CheY-like chemotaxis protein
MPSPANVLVVEDDPDTRELLKTILKLGGYEVTTAADGAQALAAAKASRPSLVLLDLMMPVMDGMTFCQEKRQDPDISDIPVICVSAAMDGAKIARDLSVGYVSKPVDVDGLLRVVGEYCAQ